MHANAVICHRHVSSIRLFICHTLNCVKMAKLTITLFSLFMVDLSSELTLLPQTVVFNYI